MNKLVGLIGTVALVASALRAYVIFVVKVEGTLGEKIAYVLRSLTNRFDDREGWHRIDFTNKKQIFMRVV